jgi:AraC family transcriptional regulator
VSDFLRQSLAPRFDSLGGLAISTSRFTLAGGSSGMFGNDGYAMLQFALAQRKVPLRGRLPDDARGWQNLGAIVYAPPGMQVDMQVPCGMFDTMVVRFEPSWLDEIELPREYRDGPLPSLNVEHPGVRNDLARLADAIRKPRFGQRVFVEGACRVIFYELMHALCASGDRSRHLRGGLSQWRKRIIAERLDCGLSPLPSIDELAGLCKLSSRHLMRAYREEYGHTLGEEIRRGYVRRAKALLAGGSVPIYQIATQLGFASTTSFAVAFRRDVGCLPSEYRVSARH